MARWTCRKSFLSNWNQTERYHFTSSRIRRGSIYSIRGISLEDLNPSVNAGKIQNARPSPSAIFEQTNIERSIESILHVPLDLFPESELGDDPKNGVYFCWEPHISPHFWHMPFYIKIIRLPNWHSILSYKLIFPEIAIGDGPRFGFFFSRIHGKWFKGQSSFD